MSLNVGAGSNSTNSQCPYYDDWKSYNDTMKEGIQNFALASFDALQNWFFWTWKVRSEVVFLTTVFS